MEKTVELEIRSLLPGVDSDEDICIHRLETALQNRRDLQKAHIERSDGSLKVCLHYDPDKTTLADVKRSATLAGVEIVNRYKHEAMPIKGLDCSDCAMVVEHSLGRMDGVLSARVNYAAQKLWVEYDSHMLTHRSIEHRIQSLGYEIPLDGRRKWLVEHHETLLSLGAGLLLCVGWLGGRLAGFPAPVSLALYAAAYLAGGWEVAQHAFHALMERRFDTDLLMIIAALGAAALGDYAEGALLIFLFSLGHALEERALDKARTAVEALGQLTPKTALVRRDGAEVDLPVQQVTLRDQVIIRPSTRIAVDGIVLAGTSSVDQANVTGESIPVVKSVGDKVYAGTLNTQGALEVQVTRLAADSTLARVMKMVEEAQVQKSPTQQTMEHFERVFVPIVLGATLLVIFIPPLFGLPLQTSFLRAMTLLVAASPCALALGAPAATLAGIAQAARSGVLVKGGAHLENLGRVKAMAFDKTGTVTRGKPQVTDVISITPEEYSKEQILALAAAVESRSTHPLAQAVVDAAQASGALLTPVGDVTALTSRGMQSTYAERTVLLGTRLFLAESGVDITHAVAQQVESLEQQGKTVILLAVGAETAGLIAAADTIRPDVHAVLEKLRSLGVEKTVLLTGDNPIAAASISQQAGFSESMAEMMPEEKERVIHSLVDRYGTVAMVGDGVNDAPALASATVGIAMGGAGTDVALETADVALMSDNLAQLPFAVGLGRATRRIITENLVIALGVIAVLVGASLTGWIGIGVAIIVHESSTLVVVLNAMRLLAYAQR